MRSGFMPPLLVWVLRATVVHHHRLCPRTMQRLLRHELVPRARKWRMRPLLVQVLRATVVRHLRLCPRRGPTVQRLLRRGLVPRARKWRMRPLLVQVLRATIVRLLRLRPCPAPTSPTVRHLLRRVGLTQEPPSAERSQRRLQTRLSANDWRLAPNRNLVCVWLREGRPPYSADENTLCWDATTEDWVLLAPGVTPILASEDDRGRYQREVQEYSLYGPARG
ncbi:hypothetical protein C8R44DRAFT_886055 [Mycena epipterygia]|nr:hypothetical protein C8R44DRAFT_886055 [Mycena epipterygia]